MKRKIIGSILVIILFMQVLMPTVLGAQRGQADNKENTNNTTNLNDEEIQFEDENLKSLLINNYRIDEDSNGIITYGELKNLTEINIGTQVSSLKGLENADNLKKITIDPKNVDVVKQIQNIKSITDLQLNSLYEFQNNTLNIRDIGEILNLERLSVTTYYENVNINFEGIENYNNIVYLHIASNNIQNIESISKLTNIQEFYFDGIYNKPILSEEFFDNMKSIKNINLNSIGNTNVTFLNNLSLEYLTIRDSENIKDWTGLKNCNIQYLSLQQINELNSNLLEVLYSKELENTYVSCDMNYNVNIGNIKLNEKAEYNFEDIVPIFKEIENKDGKFYSDTYSVQTNSPTNDNNLSASSTTGTLTINTSKVGKAEGSLTINAINLSIYVRLVWTIESDGDNTKEIIFEDNNLKQFMINNYDFDKDEKITEYDVNQISELNIYNTQINSLVGLENLKNVQKINITNINTSDLSPIANLSNITYLNISGNKEMDLNTLGDYPNLDNLTIYAQSYKNGYSKISSYKNLTTLYISKCIDFDGTILEKLNKLTYLGLNDGNIKDIEFISKLKNLQTLSLNNNEITNIEALVNLMNLTYVSLSRNPINPEEEGNKRTIEALKQRNVDLYIDEYDQTENITFVDEEIKKQLLEQGYDINKDNELSTYEMQQLQSFYNYSGNITSLEDLKYATNLTSIYIAGIRDVEIDITPIANLTKLQSINIRGNNINWGDFSALKNMTNLKKLEVGMSYVSSETIKKDLDFEGLKENTNLDSFSVSGNYPNISEALTMINLKELEISQMGVTQTSESINLEPIKNFKRLEKLHVEGNFTGLNNIYENNNITDLTIRDTQYNYSYNNVKKLDISGITNMTNLKKLNLSGYIEDITPLKQIKNLDEFYFAGMYYYDEKGNIHCLEDKEILDLIEIMDPKKVTLGGLCKSQIGKFEKGNEQVLNFKDAGKMLNALSTEGNKLYDSDYSLNISNSNEENIIADNENKQFKLKCDEVGTYSTQLYMNSEKYSGNIYIIWQVYENGDTTKEIEIKDEKLKTYLLENYDIDNDDKLTENDVINIDTIDISNMEISSLEGLENFKNLKKIYAENNNISNLEPISSLKKLEYIDFNNNQIKDVSPLAEQEETKLSGKLSNNLIEDITSLKDAKINLYNSINFAGNYIDISEGTENRKAIEEKVEDEFQLEYTIPLFEMSQKYGSPDEREDVLNIKDNLKQKFIDYGIDKNSDGQITKGELNDFNTEKIYGEGSTFRECKIDLSNMGLEDKNIECLSYLSCISELDLSNNNLRDVSPITHIKNVRKLNLSNNNVDVNTLTNKGHLIELNLSNNNITDISALDKLGYDSGGYGWGAGGDLNIRIIKIDLSYNNITNIDVIKNIRLISKLNLSHNKITDISPLKDYDFVCYENDYDGQVNEMLELFEDIDVSYNNIDINKEGNKQAIKVFEDKGVKLIYDNQTVTNPDAYVGDLNTELFQFNKSEQGGAAYISGEIVVVEWVNNVSTVPTKTPKMRFISTDGEVNMEVFVTPTGTNTYYFDRYIEGIDTSKEYKFMVESADPNNVSEYNKVPVYFKGQWAGKVLGEYHNTEMKLVDNKIVFEEIDNTYVGDLNTELFQFNKSEQGGAAYISGEIVVVEWVDGVSTVPTKTPKMRFVSTDGTVNMEVFVTPTGTNTYYFDRYIEGIDTTKEYKFMVESTDPNNVSEYNKVPVYFKGQWAGKVLGEYHDTEMKLVDNKIVFEEIDNTYVGDLNTELFQFNKSEQGGAAYISGEIVVVEWVNGVSTVPTKTPKMRFVSTDGTVDMEVFVTPTGTNTYYFDRYIEGIDTTKEYKFMVESTDPNNVSEYNKVPVYFKGQWENKVLGQYHDTEMKLVDNKIVFE